MSGAGGFVSLDGGGVSFDGGGGGSSSLGSLPYTRSFGIETSLKLPPIPIPRSLSIYLCTPLPTQRISPLVLGPNPLVCRPLAASPAVYTASIPSGMITIRLVPTKTPIPIVEIRRSCDEDSVMERGSAPARKELEYN